jgi:hypothetical protein
MTTKFQIEETTIDGIHTAYKSHALTAEVLVAGYLERIEKIDKSGPKINSIISVNPQALSAAKALDAEYAKSGKLAGPLHGIPVVVKDQVETKDVMTTFGSAAQNGYIPKDDATVIKKMKAAGAIILAKTAMPDYATSWFAFCSQIGETKNPYFLSRDRRFCQSRDCRRRRGYRRIDPLAFQFYQPRRGAGDARPYQPQRHVAPGRISGYGRPDGANGAGRSDLARLDGRLRPDRRIHRRLDRRRPQGQLRRRNRHQ